MATPAPATVPNGLADYLCFSTYSANLAFNRVYKPLLDALGLTYPQYLALVLLWTEDDQSVGQLGDKLFLESNTLTPLLKRLEALGHVARSRDPKDERVVRIRLTDKGRALAEQARCVPEEILKASGASPAELGRLNREMAGLRDRLLEAGRT
jgi:DNA-binding MarR family transcriptional regulator